MTNPYAPPQAIVHDVVDPAAGIQLADRGTRLGAALLDGLIFGFMVYLPFMFSVFVNGTTSPGPGRAAVFGAPGWIGLSLTGIGFIVWMFFTVKFLGENGQSIGKKACKIKLLRTDGSEVSISRVLIGRNVINGILGIIPLYGIIDVLFIFGNARRCVHDYIADTIVIKA
jgi:uncharacterized RDD family membrane protein YckC